MGWEVHRNGRETDKIIVVVVDSVVNMRIAVTIFNLNYRAGGGSFDEFVPTGCNEGGLTTSIHGAIVAVAIRVALALSF